MRRIFRAFSPAEGNGTPFTQVRPDGTTRKGIRGYDESDGIMVPNPKPTEPKAGHWRVARTRKVIGHHLDGERTPLHRDVVRIQGVKRTNIRNASGNSGRVDGDYVQEDILRARSRRERRRSMVAELYAMGMLDAADLTPSERRMVGAE